MINHIINIMWKFMVGIIRGMVNMIIFNKKKSKALKQSCIRKTPQFKTTLFLTIIMMLISSISPAASWAAEKNSQEVTATGKNLSLTVSADSPGPYLAGSTHKFTVSVTNLSSNKDLRKGNIRIIPSITDAGIASDNADVLAQPALSDNLSKETTWSKSFDIEFNTTLDNLDEVAFKVDVNVNDNNFGSVSAELPFSVKKLEGIIITEGRDLGSSFGNDGELYLQYAYINYDSVPNSYTYKVMIDGNEVSQDSIEWDIAPSGTLNSGKKETVRLKIPSDILKPGKTSYDIALLITDRNNLSSEKVITVSKASADVITSDLPSGVTLEQLYYGSVAADDSAPFHNAAQLRALLDNSSKSYAEYIWNKYKYDLYDPNFSDRGGCKAQMITEGSVTRPDYADELLQLNDSGKTWTYPKDSLSPFHNSLSATVKPAEGVLKNGYLEGSDDEQFTNLRKTAEETGESGGASEERSYKINLKARTDIKKVKPIAMVFQVQTSWQMFDLNHANDNASLVNGVKVNEDLLSLYEMKQGFRDFIEWMEDRNDGALMIGITNFQHGGSYSMINQKISNKVFRHFSNDADEILSGINGWDSFGDCEHIHYSDNALKTAAAELGDAANFTDWADEEGNKLYDSADVVSVIIGGACEAADLKESKLLIDIPSKNYGNVKKQYGISTNKGKIDDISWMDYENKSGKFNSGKYYKGVTTREEFFETLKNLYHSAMGDLKVEEVVMEDTVTDPFDVDISEIRAYIDGVDVTDECEIKAEVQADGTTKVVCVLKNVSNHSDINLEIPAKVKDDFVGGTDVHTNTGTPTISDNEGHIQKFTEDPVVYVPAKGMTAKVKFKKVIDNYSEYGNKLEDDEFVISASDTKNLIDADIVLKNGETSAAAIIKNADEIKVSETVPSDYVFNGITVEGTGADADDVNGNKVKVKPGDDITIVLHNSFMGHPYFHTFDTVMNRFRH